MLQSHCPCNTHVYTEHWDIYIYIGNHHVLSRILEVGNGMLNPNSGSRERVVEETQLVAFLKSYLWEGSNHEGRVPIPTINPDKLTLIQVQSRFLEDVAA